jgi:hypothetical protein
MDCETATTELSTVTTELSEEHLEKFSEFTGDFLEKYFSKEFISTLEIEVKFIRKERKIVERSLTMGCIQGDPEDLVRCCPGQKWGKKP